MSRQKATRRISIHALAPRLFAALPTLSLCLSIGCASGLPAVLTSTDATVAVEFAQDGNLGEASKLAQEACAKHGKNAEFDKVDMTATPGTRVARYKCTSEGSTAPANSGSDASTDSATDEPAAEPSS